MKKGLDWHISDVSKVVDFLEVDASRGLTDAQVIERRKQFGSNELPTAKPRSVWKLLLEQFQDLMIIVLVLAAFISGLVGEVGDTIVILVIVLLNGVIGFTQSFRAEKAIIALREFIHPTVKLIRNSRKIEIPAAELVPGDIVELAEGDYVPADCRVIESRTFTINESVLTGESFPVLKKPGTLDVLESPLGDRFNMIFQGTLVVKGRAAACVVSTGRDTELGRIAQMLSAEPAIKTPLQERLAVFGKRLSWIVLLICISIFVAGVLRGEGVLLMFLTSVSLAVAAIPEALPAVVSISLALGARKMVQHNMLVRNLPAVETLGSVTYICSDKTGTLTMNKMRAEAFYVAGEWRDSLTKGEHSAYVQACVFCNDASVDEKGNEIGDPTEIAILKAAITAGESVDGLRAASPRQAEFPFDSERKRMSTIHKHSDEYIAFMKGSPESVISHCVNEDQDVLLQQAEIMAAKGYRVLALSQKGLGTTFGSMTQLQVEDEHRFLGLIALMDPPRDEVIQAISECKTAGITPVMITGDHPATAKAIALRIGLASESDLVVDGHLLDSWSEDELKEKADRLRVFARVSPEQKIRIVAMLQSLGEYVAMTGDGVNDAPALKRANIGVAMGLKGTAVAREAADTVLLDDNFASIVAAVREGRRIYDNIRKFIKYTMTSNSGEIWILFLAPFLGLPIPLLPIHILWVNLVTDGLPGLALSMEKSEGNIMQRPPRTPSESIFSGGMWQHILGVGLLIGAVSLVTQAVAVKYFPNAWQTMVFTVLTFSQLLHVLAIRSEQRSFFSMNFFSNTHLIVAVGFTVLLQLFIIYHPWMNEIFKTTPLSMEELLICCMMPFWVLCAIELDKIFYKWRLSQRQNLEH